MRRIVFLLLITLPIQFTYGQDIISIRDKKQLNVKIIEQRDKAYMYRMPDYEDGPLLMIRTNRITKIEYKNGFTDLMGYQNPRKTRPLGISAGYAAELTSGGALFSATLDYFVMPQVDIEVNIGTSDLSGELYYAAGGRFHINSKYSERKLTPFTGILAGSYYGDGFVQIPAGINYLTGMGINASLSINEMISFKSWQAIFLELRLGWRFKL
ncbi:MAG: hypothetical protein IPJ37_22380 [Bacteroidales bacterium]|nr:hypothetical protein [Bacteroidales bacterium]